MPPSETLRTFLCTNLVIPYERSEMFFTKLQNVPTLKCQVKNSEYGREHSKLILKLDTLSHLESLRVQYKTFADTAMEFNVCNLEATHLEVLKLDGGIFGETWNVEDEEFQNLKFLRLKTLGIEELNASDNSFPRLKHFVVEKCAYLQEIPPSFVNILTLKIIEVDPHLEISARQIQEEQKDLGNDPELLIPSRYW
ncbi:hypothetical protein M9H77_14271 [Catharanthus roseus]|uniref:Uncharacterized protein n=1 Tax=Catharanthus roseus TaxID=4058 RepID=A0ACC0BMR7_CATRO|nr:hypothetical protein M9H77_14271 [Catharanthus roseus]